MSYLCYPIFLLDLQTQQQDKVHSVLRRPSGTVIKL